RGVYRTADGGVSWTQVLGVSDETGATDIERDPLNPDVLYAATYQRRRKIWALLAGGSESGIYKSSDGGVTWREVAQGLPKKAMGKINLAVSPMKPNVVYATIEADADEKGFYRSEDYGESWTKRNSYTSGGTGPHYYQEIYASPHAFDRVYQMDVWINVTDNGGEAFRPLGEPQKHSDNHALAFVPDDPDYLLAGSDGGLYESFDHGGSWRYVSNLPITQFYKMALDYDEPFYNVIGGTQDNGTLYGPSRTTSTHGLQNRDWLVTYGADGYSTAIDYADPNTLYFTWQNGHLLRYDRRTREPLDIQPQPAPGDEPERWNWDAPLLISPHSNSRIYYGSQRLWRSDDRGNSWTPVSGDLSRGRNRYDMPMVETAPGTSALYDNSAMSWYGNTTTISESPLVEGLIYLGTDDGLIQVTENGGANWRRVESIDGVPSTAFVNDIKASVADANTVFAALDNHKEGDYSPYLVRSTDRGRSWSSISGDLPPRHLLWSIAQDHVDPDLIFLGTEFGVFFTLEGGNRWTRLGGGAPTIPFRDIEIQRRESDLVASTFGRGFYVLDDYGPLRKLPAEALAGDALLFPTRSTYRYVESTDLGVPGQGYQGSDHYYAPNPPFGAVFTYYLGEDPKTPRELREEGEKAIRGRGENVPFPGWEALSEESRAEDPQIILTLSDTRGNVIRRLAGPDTKGFHRIAWDLRYPAPNPVELDPGPVEIWGPAPAGPMVAPGTYRAQLARLVDGELRPLAEPRDFEVVDLYGDDIPRGDPTDNLAFQKETADVQRRAESAAAWVGESLNRLAHMEKAVLLTPRAQPDLLQQISALENRLADISVILMGDRVRGSLWEPSQPSILGRVGQISGGHWWTTEAPTETFRQSLGVAARQLGEVEGSLAGLSGELLQLEGALKAAGAPWTPGQRIGG
ncbi:MAG: glycosyl hydrolase, partial [Gemmatimonadota bacterium]